MTQTDRLEDFLTKNPLVFIQCQLIKHILGGSIFSQKKCYMSTVFISATSAATTHCEVVRLRLLLIGSALGQCHLGGGASSRGLVREAAGHVGGGVAVALAHVVQQGGERGFERFADLRKTGGGVLFGDGGVMSDTHKRTRTHAHTSDLLCFQSDGSESRLKLLEPRLQLVPHLALRTHLAHLQFTNTPKGDAQLPEEMSGTGAGGNAGPALNRRASS